MNAPVRALLVLAIGSGIGIAADRLAFAQPQQPSAIKRTVLQRVDAPGNPGYEAVMAIAEIPAGASSGKHFHHGVELAYILDGSMTVEAAGKPVASYKTGEPLKNDSGGVHNAINKSKKPVKILAVYLVEKGKPMAESVP